METTRYGDFRDLLIWQRGMQVVLMVYRVSRDFPEEERWGLRAQMRAAAVSIPSNIAEGFRRQSRPEFRRHLRIAFGSLGELQTQAWVCERLGLPAAGFRELHAPLDELSRMLHALIAKVR